MSNNINSGLIKASIILTILILMLASYIWLSPMFEIKDGKVEIPETLNETTNTTTVKDTTDEELTYKGTFTWEELDSSQTEYTSTFYLRIQTFEGERMAKFSFGEYLVDGWPVYLVSNTDNRYIFESSSRSFVEEVRITFDITDTDIKGTVKNITPDISTFVQGSFEGEEIPFEEYKAEVLD
jgi:hypothetical protein